MHVRQILEASKGVTGRNANGILYFPNSLILNLSKNTNNRNPEVYEIVG